LELGDGPLFDIHDTYMNSVKEVCYISKPGEHSAREVGTLIGIVSRPILYGMVQRKVLCPCRKRTLPSYGTQFKTVYALPHPTSTTTSLITTQSDDLAAFQRVNSLLLNPLTPLKHIPLRIYIPSTPPISSSPSDYGSFKIVQTLIPPLTKSRETQTLGSALNTILPSLFPSSRDAIMAEPILHGAAVPFRAPLEQLMREAAYADGWLHLSVVMIDA
jgi:autophagy-related protein 5